MDGLRAKLTSNKNLKNLKIKSMIKTNKIEEVTETENKKTDKNHPLILVVNIQKLLMFQLN